MKMISSLVFVVFITFTAATNNSDSSLVNKMFELLTKEATERKILAAEVAELKDIIKKGNIQGMVKKVNTNQNDIKEMKNRMYGDNKGVGCKHPIAFYVRQAARKTFSNQVVTYDTVVTDPCGTYNRRTGVFRCPVDGLYFFTYHILDDASGRTSFVEMRKNRGIELSRVWITGEKRVHKMGGNSVIAKLKKDDTVYVYVRYKHFAYVNPDRYASFSGFRLV